MYSTRVWEWENVSPNAMYYINIHTLFELITQSSIVSNLKFFSLAKIYTMDN